MKLIELLEVYNENKPLTVYSDGQGDTLAEYDGHNAIPACLNECEVLAIDPDGVTIDATDTLLEIANAHVENMTDDEAERYTWEVWDVYNNGFDDDDQWDEPDEDRKAFLRDWAEVDPEMAITLLDINLEEVQA